MTDARKGHHSKVGVCILLNLLRYQKNQSEYFWIVTIAREMAYLRTSYLNYTHQKFMREVIVTILSREQGRNLGVTPKTLESTASGQDMSVPSLNS